jgi:thiamine pyrophosphokinase
MAKCVIFCAGGFNGLAEPVCDGDFVIAADGGLVHLQKEGVAPNEVLGDFDSLGYTPENAAVFPVEKDDTDAMLAVRRGLELGYREFLLYGSLDGPRLDHTLANLQVLEFLAQQGAKGYLVGIDHIVTLVKNGSLQFPAEAEGIVSVFCLGQDAKGVTLKGLKYPLENGTLTAGFPLGVSNHFTGTAAEICVEEGSLWVIYQRSNGICR